MNKRLFLKAAAIGLGGAIVVDAVVFGLMLAAYLLNLPTAVYCFGGAFLITHACLSYLAFDHLRQKEWQKRREDAPFVKAEIYSAKGDRI